MVLVGGYAVRFAMSCVVEMFNAKKEFYNFVFSFGIICNISVVNDLFRYLYNVRGCS